MVPAATGPHRRLLEAAQPGRRLAGVPHPSRAAAAAGRLDVSAGERGDARQVVEEVQGGALGREDRRQRTPHGADRLARPHVVAVVGDPLDVDGAVELGEGLGGAAGAGEHAGAPGDERGDRRRAGVEEAGGEVAEGEQVLGQRHRHGAADLGDRRVVERRHRCSTLGRRSRT